MQYRLKIRCKKIQRRNEMWEISLEAFFQKLFDERKIKGLVSIFKISLYDKNNNMQIIQFSSPVTSPDTSASTSTIIDFKSMSSVIFELNEDASMQIHNLHNILYEIFHHARGMFISL